MHTCILNILNVGKKKLPFLIFLTTCFCLQDHQLYVTFNKLQLENCFCWGSAGFVLIFVRTDGEISWLLLVNLISSQGQQYQQHGSFVSDL